MHADGKSTLSSVSKWNSGKVNSVFQCGFYFLYFLCLYIQKQLILHVLTLNLEVLTEMPLGNIKDASFDRQSSENKYQNCKELNPLQRMCLKQDERATSVSEISLKNLPILFLWFNSILPGRGRMFGTTFEGFCP